ncbi:P1 family peptidase [Roseomonas sp. E05]|uniref:P1 family peptidase n=1 Tax=Roseomonas sp. E05 TaxID=3046310 RepID=UPI0024B9CB8A|nr:P1 family peptidase [Roseomonas sp. E05]MDJ0391354.1 P1 family peptidase [Roseomonas sp. E05]
MHLARTAPIGGSITDVPGVKVGHFTEARRPTGCTVVLVEQGATAGVAVRGAAPGTRETDLLDPSNTVEQVHAILLAGGSAFGLSAAGGVVRWLEERGYGLPVGPARVPIVPAAILFDLSVGDHSIRPDEAAGYAACEAATASPPGQGSVGAGTGATVGKLFGIERAMKGGIGTAAMQVSGITIGAIVAVNAVGDVIDPGSGEIVAGALDPTGTRPCGTTATLLQSEKPASVDRGSATTIGVLATDAALTKAQCRLLANSAHDGLARCIDPIHTILDGDTIFAIATARATQAADMMVMGAAVPRVVTAAVLKAVRAARAVGPSPLSAVELAVAGTAR